MEGQHGVARAPRLHLVQYVLNGGHALGIGAGVIVHQAQIGVEVDARAKVHPAAEALTFEPTRFAFEGRRVAVMQIAPIDHGPVEVLEKGRTFQDLLLERTLSAQGQRAVPRARGRGDMGNLPHRIFAQPHGKDSHITSRDHVRVANPDLGLLEAFREIADGSFF